VTSPSIVVDASTLVLAVTDHTATGQRARTLLRGRRRHGPHLVDAEVGNVLRRMLSRGELGTEEAAHARLLAERAIHQRHPHRGPLGDGAWRLRDTMTFYDALYVVLARSLDCPLVTGDRRLARAVHDPDEVEVV